jgi:hypothetical protein
MFQVSTPYISFLAINKVVIGSYKVKGREEKLYNDLEVMKFEEFFIKCQIKAYLD